MADNDELWHVRISPDEVKTLTLEQIDDLYRLDVIDADTQLWQDGMDEWLPLRVVAGLDEEEVVNVSIPPTLPPPKLGTTASWPPPVAAPSAASSWPPAVSARPSAPAPSSRPAPPSSRAPAPPSSRAPAPLAASSWPPPLGASSSPAADPLGVFSSSQAPASTRPMVVAEPYNYPRPMNPMPIVLAAIIGVVVTLYRNDVLHAGARTVGQEAAYLKLEAALGGPGFGTPRAVEPMAKAAAALPDLPPPPAPTSTAAREPSTSVTRDSSSGAATKPASAPAEKSKQTSRAEPKVAARPVAPRPQADAPNSVFKQPKGAKKAKGNEFDPLNPNL